MSHLPKFRSALTAALLLAGALSLSPVAASVDTTELYPTPNQGLLIRGGEDQMTLAELISAFSEATGEHIISASDSASLFENTKVGLAHNIEVAPEQVYTVVETVLLANRVVVTDLKRSEPRMLSMSSMDTPARANLRASARFVPSEELEFCRAHPAMIVQTVLHLPNLDVRTLGNSMRAMVVDPNTMQLVPSPESNNLILTGFGQQIADLAEMLRRCDESAALSQAERQAHNHAERQSDSQPPESK